MITRLAARSLKIALLTAALICTANVLHGAAPPKPTTHTAEDWDVPDSQEGAQVQPALGNKARPPEPTKPAAEVPLILTQLEQLQQVNMQLRAALATVTGQLAQANYQLTMSELGQSADAYERQTLAAHPGAKYQLSRKGLMWEKLPEPAAPKTNPTPAKKGDKP